MKNLFLFIFLISFVLGNSQTEPKMRGAESTAPKGVSSTTPPAKVAGVNQNNASTTWEPVIEMEGNIYTSYIYAASLMPSRSQDKDDYKGDKNGQIGIKVTPSAATRNYEYNGV